MDISNKQKAVIEGLGLTYWQPRQAFKTMIISSGKGASTYLRISHNLSEQLAAVLARMQTWVAFHYEESDDRPDATIFSSVDAQMIYQHIREAVVKKND